MTLERLGGWPFVLGRLSSGDDLTSDEAAAALAEVLEGNATPSQLAAFIFGLRCKGETVEEMTGLVRAMLDAAETVPVGEELRGRLVDTCGTGGDRSGTINISTMAAFVVAGAGIPVCKHGNRASSSKSGSADVLEALGVVIDLGAEGVARCIEEAGVGFCFAPRFHPSMRHAGPTRRELGVPTVFNFLGPLANPARVRRQSVGVGSPEATEKMARVLSALGHQRALVFHGAGGLDELSTEGASQVFDVGGGEVRSFQLDPAALGLPLASRADILGGDAACNAAIIRAVLDGDQGAPRDVVLLNAAAGLLAAGIVASMEEGLAAGRESISSGGARTALQDLVRTSTSLAS